MPLLNKSQDFPPIFTKNKRNEYSGYRQNYLNKSNIIKILEQKKDDPYQPLRSYFKNRKNIEKLRKRHSLETNSIKASIKKHI